MKNPTDSTWHVGRTVGRTLYKGDGPNDLIGIMDTRWLATFVVVACNAYPALLRELELRVRNCPTCIDGGTQGGECADCARSRTLLARSY